MRSKLCEVNAQMAHLALAAQLELLRDDIYAAEQSAPAFLAVLAACPKLNTVLDVCVLHTCDVFTLCCGSNLMLPAFAGAGSLTCHSSTQTR